MDGIFVQTGALLAYRKQCPVIMIVTKAIVAVTIGHFKYFYHATCRLYKQLQARFNKLVVAAIILNTLWKALKMTIFVGKVQGRYVDLTV
jgi:hypothetical protein